VVFSAGFNWTLKRIPERGTTGKGVLKIGGHFPNREGAGWETSAPFRPEVLLAKPNKDDGERSL
jgi:hypothetical protein